MWSITASSCVPKTLHNFPFSIVCTSRPEKGDRVEDFVPKMPTLPLYQSQHQPTIAQGFCFRAQQRFSAFFHGHSVLTKERYRSPIVPPKNSDIGPSLGPTEIVDLRTTGRALRSRTSTRSLIDPIASPISSPGSPHTEELWYCRGAYFRPVPTLAPSPRYESQRRSDTPNQTTTRRERPSLPQRQNNKRRCLDNPKDRQIKYKGIGSLISGTLLALFLAIYLGLAISKSVQGQTFHVVFIVFILVLTMIFCHFLIRLSMLSLRLRIRGERQIHQPPTTADEEEYAQPDTSIPVILARDEELGLTDTSSDDEGIRPIQQPPPAYGLWRSSVLSLAGTRGIFKPLFRISCSNAPTTTVSLLSNGHSEDPSIGGVLLPVPAAARSLFLVNVPFDSTESHIKHLLSLQLGLPPGRIEEIQFEGSNKRDGILERAVAEPGKEKNGRKRKRGYEHGDIEELDGAALPATWDRDLRTDGRTAVVVFVDRLSMDAAYRAVKKVQKEGTMPIWGEGIQDKVPSLGFARYLNHHESQYPNRSQVLEAVNTYMTEFAAREAAQVRLQARQRQVPDEDGFITVTKGGRTGAARQDTAKDLALKQKEKQKGLEDFYRFQTRDKKKAKAVELMKKFEDDQARVQKMKERRGMFRDHHTLPYTLLPFKKDHTIRSEAIYFLRLASARLLRALRRFNGLLLRSKF
ncbi:MAG: hypothetical protein Q9213_004827 [Squamulea squamosa]